MFAILPMLPMAGMLDILTRLRNDVHDRHVMTLPGVLSIDTTVVFLKYQLQAQQTCVDCTALFIHKQGHVCL